MKRGKTMKKITKIITTFFGFVFASCLPLTGMKYSPKPAKADGLNHLGTVSISEVKVFNSNANGNEFLMLKLVGSDYPSTSTDPKEVSKDTLTARGYEIDLASSISFIDSSNNKISVTNYNSVYSNQHTYASYFSMWMLGMGGSKAAHIKSNFKIPSYALLCGDKTSEKYGYYTLDKDYELYADDINYGNVINTYDWHFDAYTPSHAYITKAFTYIDSGKEMLTFELFGLGVDYPITPGSGNYHFDFSKVSSLLPNFKEKVVLYDENKNTIAYDLDFICSIDLWTTFPRFTVGINNLVNAKYLRIYPGISLPSYAKQQNNTTSGVYDGFVTVNADELYLEIDPTAAHTHGTIINWLETHNVIGTLSLESFKTQKPNGWGASLNEFQIFNFNEQTDFVGVPQEKWSPDSLMPNAKAMIELYDNLNSKIDTSLISSELMFNYAGSNNICICLNQSKNATKIILKEGLLFPSYALYKHNSESPTYGYYSLACDYTLLIGGDNTHQEGVLYDWELPKSTIEYYDENNNIISTYTDHAVCGSTYTLKSPVLKDGYYASWEVIEPNAIVINDNKITVPFTGETIKFKAHYEAIPVCLIEYYDEDNNLIAEYTDQAFYGATYTIRDTIAKDGYYASWEIIEPDTLVIDDNKITIPLTGETIKIKAHYELIPLCTIEYYDEDDQVITDYSKTVQCGQNYYLEQVVSKKGYDASWEVVEPNTLVIDGNKFFIQDSVTSIKFKIHYVARTYTLSFDGYPSATKNIDFDENIGDLPEIPEIIGKVGHWMIDEEIITSETIYSWDDNKTAQLQYVDRICVLTFDTAGGSAVDDVEILYGTSLNSLPITQKEGFYFVKWVLDEAGEIELTTETLIEDDYMVHAIWVKECIVTFDTDGGSLIESLSMGAGSILNQPSDPTKEGYKFLYWTLDGLKFEFGNAINENITLKANWEKLPEEKNEKTSNEQKKKTLLIVGISASSTVLLAGAGIMVFLFIKKKKV